MTKQPSILKQVVMLAEYAKDVVLNGGGKTTPEEATRRWQICLACPLLVSDMPDRLGRVDGQKRCTDCGCSMGLKVGNQAAKCANNPPPSGGVRLNLTPTRNGASLKF